MNELCSKLLPWLEPRRRESSSLGASRWMFRLRSPSILLKSLVVAAMVTWETGVMAFMNFCLEFDR